MIIKLKSNFVYVKNNKNFFNLLGGGVVLKFGGDLEEITKESLYE